MDTTLPNSYVLKNKLISKATKHGIMEAFLESAPQLVMQLSLYLETNASEIGTLMILILYSKNIVKPF